MADDPATKPKEKAKFKEPKEGKGLDDLLTRLALLSELMEQKGEKRSDDSTTELASPSKI